ncbi:PadR family transcriptional regulator [Marinihelvus fidelis]|uniref:PadR family transcriptional regulator n=1 Tax=Marinihelvus fidelis TaxID=2613842 RepID=A0A5N0TC73_9GAMM|nr:PadR family transcriptional regulator [Marinihelvus fidelis]
MCLTVVVVSHDGPTEEPVLPNDYLETLRSEMRRGAIVLAVLGQLRREHYGYSLRKALADQGLSVEEGTLYPLVRRLEQQGLLASEWRVENKRRKRFYRLSDEGRIVFEQLSQDWAAIDASLRALTGDIP